MKSLKTTVLLSIAALTLSACDIQQTEEGKLPDVDVNVEGGNLPKYDVDAGDVDVKMKKKVIEVPVLEYDTPAEDEAEDGTR